MLIFYIFYIFLTVPDAGLGQVGFREVCCGVQYVFIGLFAGVYSENLQQQPVEVKVVNQQAGGKVIWQAASDTYFRFWIYPYIAKKLYNVC